MTSVIRAKRESRVDLKVDLLKVLAAVDDGTCPGVLQRRIPSPVKMGHQEIWRGRQAGDLAAGLGLYKTD